MDCWYTMTSRLPPSFLHSRLPRKGRIPSCYTPNQVVTLRTFLHMMEPNERIPLQMGNQFGTTITSIVSQTVGWTCTALVVKKNYISTCGTCKAKPSWPKLSHVKNWPVQILLWYYDIRTHTEILILQNNHKKGVNSRRG